VRCQGPLRSLTCSRASLAHNRYFWLSCATFSAYARKTAAVVALGLLVSYRTLAAAAAKNGRISAAIALLPCNTRAGTQTLAELQRYHRTQP